jgi:hypothetical protein
MPKCFKPCLWTTLDKIVLFARSDTPEDSGGHDTMTLVDQFTVGATRILQHMLKHGLKLHGNTSRDVPFVFLSTNLTHRVRESVDAPAAECVELSRYGLIEFEDVNGGQSARVFRLSESGMGAATTDPAAFLSLR